MNDEWQNIINNYKKVRSNKLLFVEKPVFVEMAKHYKFDNIELKNPIAPNNDRKYIRSFEPEYRLDLHSLNKHQAFRELKNFINLNFQRGNRKLIIITGKGLGEMGVLRSSIYEWLNNYEIRYMIASYSQASKRYGGTGAFFISLKKL